MQRTLLRTFQPSVAALTRFPRQQLSEPASTNGGHCRHLCTRDLWAAGQDPCWTRMLRAALALLLAGLCLTGRSED
jgi:hypothetical protein